MAESAGTKLVSNWKNYLNEIKLIVPNKETLYLDEKPVFVYWVEL